MASDTIPERFKDPDDILDYGFRWGVNWLTGSEVVNTSTWIIPDGLTKDSDSISGGTITIVWLSGGTIGATYRIVNRIVTDSTPTRTKDHSMDITIKDR